MKEIILEESNNTIKFEDVNRENPIFIKKDGKLVGMVILENNGWIIKVGGAIQLSRYHDDLHSCLRQGVESGFTFHVESFD